MSELGDNSQGIKKMWRVEPAADKIFSKTYYLETGSQDKIHVDLNYYNRLVRITLESRADKGKIYTSTIRNGQILKEFDLESRTSRPLFNKFFSIRDYISNIPNSDVLEVIQGNYGISLTPAWLNRKSRFQSRLFRDSFYEKKRDPFWKRYLESRNLNKIPLGKRIQSRILGDLFDCILGLCIGLGIYYFYFDFVFLGISTGILGFVFGGFDWLIRNRNPLFTKIFLFLGSGLYIFYYGFINF